MCNNFFFNYKLEKDKISYKFNHYKSLNNLIILDLNKDIHEQSSYDGAKYDLVTDFGTLEHCGNYYQALKNAYDLNIYGFRGSGGVIIIKTK